MMENRYKKEDFDFPGVYAFRNIINGLMYIGSAFNMWERMMEHLGLLRIGKHNKRFQPAWNVMSENNFEFIILERTERNDDVLLEREQFNLINKGILNL